MAPVAKYVPETPGAPCVLREAPLVPAEILPIVIEQKWLPRRSISDAVAFFLQLYEASSGEKRFGVLIF